MPYANNKGADQPAHPCSLITTFVIRCLDGIIPLVSISEISSLYLVAVQASSSLPWSQTLKIGFLMMWLNYVTYSELSYSSLSGDKRPVEFSATFIKVMSNELKEEFINITV